MKNNTRKILLALILVFTMIMSLATVSAFAEGADTKTFYFSNNKGWSSVNLHYWGGASESKWPGVAATHIGTNELGEGVFSIDVPADATHIIFNDGSSQTVDIDLSAHTPNNGFYLETQDGEGKWTVGSYPFNPDNITAGGGNNTGSGGTVETPEVDGLELAVGDYYLAGYINNADYGIEKDSANLGSYKFVNGKLTVELTAKSYVIVKDSTNSPYWTSAYVDGPTSATYTKGSVGEKMSVPAGKVTFTLYKGDGDTLILSYTSEGGSDVGGGDIPTIDEEDTVRVYAGNSAEWDTVLFYCWVSGGSQYVEWPGLEMDIDENGYWYADVPKACDNIIFNNGAGQQTEDLKTPTDDKNVCDIAGCLKGTGKINSWFTKADYKPSEPVVKEDTDRKVTLVLKNDANWEHVFVYYWSSDGTPCGDWPGIEIGASEDGLFYAVIPEGNYYVIFNNGNGGEGNQTGDMVIPTDDNVLYNNATDSWSEMRLEANHPVEDNNKPGNDSGNTEVPGGEMSFLQKMAKALLLFLRSIEDFFKGLFPKK